MKNYMTNAEIRLYNSLPDEAREEFDKTYSWNLQDEGVYESVRLAFEVVSEEWSLGTVHWFDDLSGDGIVKNAVGKGYYVHYSAIDSDSPWKSLQNGQSVWFKLVQDTTFSQVVKIRELE